MKSKQIIAVIVACVIFLITGISGLLSARMLNSYMDNAAESVTSITSGFSEIFKSYSRNDYELPDTDYIARVNVIGTIQESNVPANPLVSSGGGYDHNFNMKYVDRLIADDKNKAIFLYVDSPGGTVYHADEFYLKLMEYKEKTGRPIYAYFASQACSGGYYISMAADKIYANRNGWTGSIGVIISLMNYKGLLDRLGIKEIDIISAENKTLGSATQEMSETQEEILQSLVDESYDQFVDIVAAGRGLPVERVRQLGDGRIYSASQAKSNGLVDEIKGFEDTEDTICSEFGLLKEDIFYPEIPSNSLFNMIYGITDSLKKSSDSDIRAVTDLLTNDESGVLFYYAK